MTTTGQEQQGNHAGRAGRWGGTVLRRGGTGEGGREMKQQLMNRSRCASLALYPQKLPQTSRSPSARGATEAVEAREAKKTQARSSVVHMGLCFTFLTGSFTVMNHLQGSWSRLWSWMVSSWHCPHWTAENSSLSLERQRDGTATVARRRT